MKLTVIICTHKPNRGRLARTLDGLRAQSLPNDEWELLLVDNASTPQLDDGNTALTWHPNARIVAESQVGLTAARVRGFREASGTIFVLVDDDNVLDPQYLLRAWRIAMEYPSVGAFGGKSLPAFEEPPPAWISSFWPILALRDEGDFIRLFGWNGAVPPILPIGAGMIVRASTAAVWIEELSIDSRRARLGRTGAMLLSGEDSDLALSSMKRGWQVGYFPELRLTHLIPASRCSIDYLAKLNWTNSMCWMQLLSFHGINPWPNIPTWSVPLRQAKSWVSLRAWSGAVARIRWAGACGHFVGRTNQTP